MNIKLGKVLREVRKDARLSQSEVAEIVSCSRGSYSGWENDDGEIPLTKLLLLLKYCKVSLTTFIKRVQEENNLSQLIIPDEAGLQSIDLKAELTLISDQLKLINQNMSS